MTLRTITFDDEQWQVVPKRPTTGQVAAGMLHGHSDDTTTNRGLAYAIYDDMLHAAPEPPAQQPMTLKERKEAARESIGYWKETAALRKETAAEWEKESSAWEARAKQAEAKLAAQQPMTDEQAKALIPPVLEGVPAGHLQHVSTGYLIAMMRAVERHHGIGKGESND